MYLLHCSMERTKRSFIFSPESFHSLMAQYILLSNSFLAGQHSLHHWPGEDSQQISPFGLVTSVPQDLHAKGLVEMLYTFPVDLVSCSTFFPLSTWKVGISNSNHMSELLAALKISSLSDCMQSCIVQSSPTFSVLACLMKELFSTVFFHNAQEYKY